MCIPYHKNYYNFGWAFKILTYPYITESVSLKQHYVYKLQGGLGWSIATIYIIIQSITTIGVGHCNK